MKKFWKFLGLANNFRKVRKTHKKYMKFVDWKVGFADNFTKFPALANIFYEARKNCEKL